MALLPRPLDLLNKTVSTAGLLVTRNIPYGRAPCERLDIYRPAKRQEPLPVILFFYGGSWQFGSRADYKFLACLLARQGFVVAVPDYRLYPEVSFPDFLTDCAAATAYMLKNAAAHGGSKAQLFLLGHSAGAYNAVMLALNPQYLQASNTSPDALAGVVGLAGPYDFLPIKDPAIKAIFATQPDINITQPVSFVREGAPPLFLLHGGADTTVLPRNATSLAAKLRREGGVVETKIYPKLGHIDILMAMLPFLKWRAPVLKDVLGFITACRDGEHAAARSELSAPMLG